MLNNFLSLENLSLIICKNILFLSQKLIPNGCLIILEILTYLELILTPLLVFFELCDENENGYLDSEELKKFFCKNLSNEEDIKTVRFVSRDFLNFF
jgi:hypothetical protein